VDPPIQADVVGWEWPERARLAYHEAGRGDDVLRSYQALSRQREMSAPPAGGRYRQYTRVADDLQKGEGKPTLAVSPPTTMWLSLTRRCAAPGRNSIRKKVTVLRGAGERCKPILRRKHVSVHLARIAQDRIPASFPDRVRK